LDVSFKETSVSNANETSRTVREVKSGERTGLRSQKLPMLLIHRKLLQSKAIAIENDLPGTLRGLVYG